jgi:hypothetical protein
MTPFRFALFAIVTSAASLASSPSQLQHNDIVTVGPNVQVSAPMPDVMHTEGMIAADPTDPRRLIVCSMFLTDDTLQSVAVYRSSDAGASWQRTFETKPGDNNVDPACAFGPDGVAYLTMMPVPDGVTMARMRIPLLRSDDGGSTWQSGGVTGGMDREWIVVDHSGGPHHGRVYVHGTVDVHGVGIRRSTLALYASSDGGRTFGRPIQWASLGRGFIFGSGNAVVLSDGRWLTVFTEMKDFFDGPLDARGSLKEGPPPEPENAWIKAIASDDGGDTLREPVVVSGEHLPNDYVRMTSIGPAMAADGSDGPFKDRVYVAWVDSRFGGTDILFSESSDRGETWSAPIVIDDDVKRPGWAPNDLLPAVAVNGAGVVAVTWLDRSRSPDNLGWQQRVRISLDGGETFQPSALVSESPARFDGREHWPTQASIKGGGTRVYGGRGPLHVEIFAPRFIYVPGDTTGLTADIDGVFHPYWVDNRTGWHQVWTAAIKVAGTAARNGSNALAALDDLTALTTLKRVTNHYDRDTHTATVTVRIENTGRETLEGPFTVRVIGLGSDVATVAVAGASNGLSGPGATWTFPDGRLEPGAASDPLTLTFSLSDIRPFVQGHTDHFDLRLVKFDARVLGHRAKRADGAAGR